MTYYALGLESVSALVRLLGDNPFIAAACGIEGDLPSQPTLSKFGTIGFTLRDPDGYFVTVNAI